MVEVGQLRRWRDGQGNFGSVDGDGDLCLVTGRAGGGVDANGNLRWHTFTVLMDRPSRPWFYEHELEALTELVE